MLERRKKYNTPFELKGIVQVEEYSDLLLKLSIIRELKQLNTTVGGMFCLRTRR